MQRSGIMFRKNVVERLFDTRWSSYFDAVHSLNGGLKNIKSDTEQGARGRRIESENGESGNGLSHKSLECYS